MNQPMNESMILGESFPELFRKPINLHQALGESGLDHYQQEQVKSKLFPNCKPGDYE